MGIEEIIENQGWTDETMVVLLFSYIENQGSMDALRDFLEARAYEENQT
jgi:hypothetical protein